MSRDISTQRRKDAKWQRDEKTLRRCVIALSSVHQV